MCMSVAVRFIQDGPWLNHFKVTFDLVLCMTHRCMAEINSLPSWVP